MPEFIDPVFTKTSPKRSFSLNRKRAFWLVFAKTGSIISGTGVKFRLLIMSLYAGLLQYWSYAEQTCRDCIQRKTWCIGPYVGVDYNVAVCRLQSRLQHIYHGQPYVRVDLNPVPELTLSPSKGLRIWSVIGYTGPLKIQKEKKEVQN